MSREILLNGQFVPYEAAVVSVDDRAVQFGESVYEVIRTYNGRPFEMGRHMRRLRTSLAAVGIDMGDRLRELEDKSLELMRRSGLEEALIYMQVSSGAAPRSHLAPAGLQPTYLATVSPLSPLPTRWLTEGIKVITVPDDRWARCYIKTTMLLPNTAAKGKAARMGCDDALFVRDGFVMEGTASNLFAVYGEVLWTPPKSNYILHGITREVLLEVAPEVGVSYVEESIPLDRLYQADELFLTGSGAELVPITSVDGKTVGSGRPGPVYARLREGYRRRALG